MLIFSIVPFAVTFVVTESQYVPLETRAVPKNESDVLFELSFQVSSCDHPINPFFSNLKVATMLVVLVMPWIIPVHQASLLSKLRSSKMPLVFVNCGVMIISEPYNCVLLNGDYTNTVIP